MQNILAPAYHRNSAPRFNGPPQSKKPDTRRAINIVSDWLDHAQSGDYAQLMFGPEDMSRCAYGQPIPAGKLFFFERLLAGGDLAIVQSFRRPLVILPFENFAALVEAV